MNVGSAEVLINLYDWLPPYGETKVRLSCDGLLLDVDVFFDSTERDELEKKTLRFRNTCFFSLSSSPGVDMCRYSCDMNLAASGALIEFQKSDAVEAWQEHFGIGTREIRHFQLFFLSENKRLDVLAEDVSVY
jgi:hypothetical protein